MKISEEQRQHIRSGLTKAIKDIDNIQARGPLNCLPELEKLCRETLPLLEEINTVLEQQIE